MFLQRALVSFTLGPLALYVIYLGGWYYFVPITAILILAALEYHHLMRQIGRQTTAWLLAPLVLLLAITGQWPHLLDTNVVLVFSFLMVMCYALWLYERSRSQTVSLDWAAMVGGVVLIGWIGSHFLRLRGLEIMPWQWTMLAMLSTWIADSGAYLVGKFMAGKILFGRHQLSPRLSPNKTVEGYGGGIVLGTLFTVVIAHYLSLPIGPALTLGLLISVVSPAGDLGISLLKREAGVKDSGHLFGEHGGALDRIDSLVWSVTFAYYLALFVS